MKLPTDVLVQCSQVGTLVLGSAGIWIAMLNQRNQLNAQMFITVTGRFQELLRLFPTEAWLANRSASQPIPPRSPEITDCTLYCLQLIADVYHLR
jgi:ABC-type phosphate/phosphonate transport system permease subunit